MIQLRTLIIEDSENDALLLLRELRRGGYEPNSQRVETADAMEAALLQQPWDVIISDYSLPHFSGIAALQLLKEIGVDLPFLIVSGTINEEMAVAAMKAGAHDYLMKGNLARLVPAVERELREATLRRESRLAEEELREKAALLDVAQDAILVLNLKDQISYWNKSAERLYGWTAIEAFGWQAATLLFAMIPPEYQSIQLTLKEKGEWQGEWHQITKSKKAIIVESRWKLLLDHRGKPKSILVINTDITEKKLIEAQFLRTQRLESIGTLAGGIAHDLNNVLSPILMGLELLKMKLPDPASQNLINTLECSAQQGVDIVKQVLAFARGLEGQKADIQINHLIREIVQMAKHTFPKSIEIVVDIKRELWLISGDATQLQQVLLNLCVNARDAMPNGGILTIKAENIYLDQDCPGISSTAKPGHYVLLSVSDLGGCIPPELIDKIFEPFFTTKPVDQGTGLGLSTVMGIVKSHGGVIHVSSDPGMGTTFKVYFPAQLTNQLNLTHAHIEPMFLGTGELILVVDDEVSILEVTKETLEKYGYRVLTAEDGTEAIALYVQYRTEIQVVIVDMKMPIMDGNATIRALRKINCLVKIIAASGVAPSIAIAQSHHVDLQAFLQKPYTGINLLKTLSNVLGRTVHSFEFDQLIN